MPHAGNDRLGVRSNFIEALIEQRAVFRIVVHPFEDHPRLAVLDPPHRLLDRQSVSRRERLLDGGVEAIARVIADAIDRRAEFGRGINIRRLCR